MHFVEPRLVSVPQIGMVSNWSHRTEFPKNQALQFMQRTIRENPGEIVLLGIGPMGNIGRLFLFDPELPRLLKGIYLMCGRFRAFDFQGWLQNTVVKKMVLLQQEVLANGMLYMILCHKSRL